MLFLPPAIWHQTGSDTDSEQLPSDTSSKYIHIIGLDVVGGVDVVVAMVVVLTSDASVKVGNAALGGEKGSSICLTLYYFLIAWWFTSLLLFFVLSVFFHLGVGNFTNSYIVGLLGQVWVRQKALAMFLLSSKYTSIFFTRDGNGQT